MPETPQTPEAIEAVIRRGPPDDLRWLPIGLSLDPPEGVDVEAICLRLAKHPDGWVRGNALIGLGHLARILRRLDADRVKPVLTAGLRDPDSRVSGCAGDAISDVCTFLGWRFPRDSVGGTGDVE